MINNVLFLIICLEPIWPLSVTHSFSILPNISVLLNSLVVNYRVFFYNITLIYLIFLKRNIALLFRFDLEASNQSFKMSQNTLGDIVFSPRAYCKMLLHCAKYPHCAVNGVLLAQSSKNPKTSTLVFVDAIPLFHICLNVAPMYEIALSQIEIMAKNEGLFIAGYYAADDNFNDTNNESIYRIANKIGEFFPAACYVSISNKNFPSIYDGHRGSQSELPFAIGQLVDGKWVKRKDHSGIIVGNEAIEKSDTLIAEKKKDIIDFDNHLDDLKLDWRNPGLNSIIEN